MTTLKLVTCDQHLVLQKQPVVASGDKNSVQVQIELCSMWDGFDVKVAFYKDGNRDFVLDIPLEDGACMVPPEMLDTPCVLNIGIWGKDASGRYKTSTMVKYRVLEGTPIEEGVRLVAVNDGTATEDQVLDGATFYAGDTTKKRGNIATFEDGEPGFVLKGDPGESAYDIEVKHGFKGTEEEWLASLKKPAEDAAKNVVDIANDAAENALEQAKESGEFDGRDGVDGKSAYEYAKDGGYTGTEEEFAEDINPDNIKAEVTPELGVDYFTENDKANIVTRVYDLIKNGGVVGFVDENNNIVLTGNIANDNYSVKYEMENGTTVDIGVLKFDYSVTNTLTNCTNSNGATSVVNGGSYTAIISANSGYELKTVTVTMGGSPVTVSGGNINIPSVTGDIVITAVAVETSTEQPTNLFVIGGDGYIANGRCSSTGEDRTNNNGYLVTNYIDIKNGDTVYIKNATVKNDTNCYSGIKLTDGTTIGLYPNNSEYITNYSESNGITQFTINKADADYIRITLEIYTDGRSATEERVSEIGIIITVNEPIV